MHNGLRIWFSAIVLFGMSSTQTFGQTPVWPAVEAMLVQGKLADAQRQLAAQLRAEPKDDNARLALGVVQTLQGVERLMQSLYRYGLDPPWTTMLPLVRLPVPLNPHPESLTNEAFRQIVADFARDLALAEATLAAIESPDVKLPLHLGMYRLDFDGDGRATDEESLWRVFSRVSGRQITEEIAARFVIGFDKGDVHWLRGYCHLLPALCEMFLAYDTRELHDHTAQLFFPTAKVRYPFLNRAHRQESWHDWVLDAVAFIHLSDLPLIEPQRMVKAHEHLLAVIEQSRASWAAILAETDDDHEWIPSPRQKNVAIPGTVMSQEMVDGWLATLDELEAILKGTKLAPFWRGDAERGVNVNRVFMQPKKFDLVLWIQGSAAAPYLEEGEITSADFWDRTQHAFRGQFFWFALWIN
jgi:hypothetical protein